MSSLSRKMIDCPSLRCRALIPNFSHTSDLVTKTLQDCVNYSLNSQFIKDMRHFLFSQCLHSYYLSSFYTLIRNICLGMQKKFITSENPYTKCETNSADINQKYSNVLGEWSKHGFIVWFSSWVVKHRNVFSAQVSHQQPQTTMVWTWNSWLFSFISNSLKIMSYRSHPSFRNVR